MTGGTQIMAGCMKWSLIQKKKFVVPVITTDQATFVVNGAKLSGTESFVLEKKSQVSCAVEKTHLFQLLKIDHTESSNKIKKMTSFKLELVID